MRLIIVTGIGGNAAPILGSCGHLDRTAETNTSDERFGRDSDALGEDTAKMPRRDPELGGNGLDRSRVRLEQVGRPSGEDRSGGVGACRVTVMDRSGDAVENIGRSACFEELCLSLGADARPEGFERDDSVDQCARVLPCGPPRARERQAQCARRAATRRGRLVRRPATAYERLRRAATAAASGGCNSSPACENSDASAACVQVARERRRRRPMSDSSNRRGQVGANTMTARP